MYKSYLLQKKTHLERYKNELGSVEKLDLNLARFYDRNKTRPRFQVHLARTSIGFNYYLEHVASVILSVRWNIFRGYFRRDSQILSLPLIVTNQLILICASIIYYILCQNVTDSVLP